MGEVEKRRGGHSTKGGKSCHNRSEMQLRNTQRNIRALVNKLVPCAWILSGALEVWSLRIRIRADKLERLEEEAMNRRGSDCIEAKHSTGTNQNQRLAVRRRHCVGCGAPLNFGRRRCAAGPKKLAAATARRWSKIFFSKIPEKIYKFRSIL